MVKQEINIMDVQPKNLHPLRYAIMSIWTGECMYAKHVHVFSDGVKLKSNCLNVFGTTMHSVCNSDCKAPGQDVT